MPNLHKLYIDSPHFRPGSRNAYLLAAAIVAVATALWIAINPVLPGVQFLTLFPAVLVTTLICGVKAGFLAVGLSTAIAWYVILPARTDFRLEVGEQIDALLSYFAVAWLDVLIVGAVREALARVGKLNVALTSAFEAMPDAILLTDQQGRIVNLNQRAASLFGRSRDGLLGSEVENLMPERFRERHVQHRAAFMASHHARAMGVGLSLFGRRPDGTEFPIDVQLGPIQMGEQSLTIAIVRDITERTALSAALAESWRRQAVLEERARGAEELRLWADAFKHAAIGIEISDPKTETIRYVNPAYAETLGVSVEEAQGRRSSDFYASGERDLLLARIEAADRTGHVTFESRQIRRDGSEFPVAVEIASVRAANGLPIYRVASSRDISEAKRTEEILRQALKMEAIGQLTGGIAHDFNNLLLAINLNFELLKPSLSAGPDVTELIDAIDASAEQARTLIAQLLAFGRRQMLRPSTLDVNEVVAGIAPMLRRLLQSSIEVRIAPEANVWPAFADRHQLETSLLNLAINARDAMPAGGRLVIETANVTLDGAYIEQDPGVVAGDYAMIAVGDNGVGMDEEQLTRAFEPFYTTKDPGAGTGLGLSQVYGFVRQSGGHISMLSELGRGTTVKLFLPRTAPGDPVERDDPVGAAPPAGRETILLVEDTDLVRTALRRSLVDLGYRVIDVGSAFAAVDILEGPESIDLLLTDLMLPGGMTGADLAARARHLRPAMHILLTSGYTQDEVWQQATQVPKSDLISKPYTVPELAIKLRDVLSRPGS